MTATLTPPGRSAAPAAPASPPRGRREVLALGGLLTGTALLHLWDLGASGWANSYYSAAVQAMSQDWTAFFFGSLDAGNVITVDKPPASLWVMALSARIFGFSSWSVLVPQALMGVATVALLYAAVRRVSGPTAGLLAGGVMALTPVAVLMFRFNNPDALLVLLMVGAAYAVVRALERAGTRWLVLAGALIGFAFLTKMGQALVVLPALALAYLAFAPTGFWRRVRQLLAAGAAMVVAAGWWIAIVELWPAESRPYIGGSEGDSVLELALGYNGLGRIFGASGGSVAMAGAPAGGPGGGGGFGGTPGITRMFGDAIGGQVSWLLPAALALLVAGLWLTRRAPRTDPVRASLVLWGTWTLVTALLFSYASGIFHEYYTVALAPGIAALVGIGGRELWARRGSWAGRAALAVVVAGTAAWAFVLLARTPDFLPWLRWVVVALGAVVALALLVPARGRRFATALAAAAVLTGLAGPAAYAVQTAATPHTGSIPTAGPAVAGADGPGGGFPGGAMGMPGGSGSPGGALGGAASSELVELLQQAGTEWSAATTGAQSGGELALSSGTTVISIGGFTGSDPAPTLAEFQAYVAAGRVHYFVPGGGPGGGGGPGAMDSAELLEQAPASVREDPRFAELLEMAESGELPGGGGAGGFGGGGGSGAEISTWVEENFTAVTVGGQTVYDLTQPLS